MGDALRWKIMISRMAGYRFQIGADVELAGEELWLSCFMHASVGLLADQKHSKLSSLIHKLGSLACS